MTIEFTVPVGLLGDSTWPEPALSALGQSRGRPVAVFIGTEAVRPLYERNPWIDLSHEPGGVILDSSRAWHWAINNRRYFAEGFFEQVGIPISNNRLYPRIYELTTSAWDVVICPFSASCSGAQGLPPNKTMPVLWWAELIQAIRDAAGRDVAIVSLGGRDEPPVEGTVSMRGVALIEAAGYIRSASVLVTPETWGCVIGADRIRGKMLVLNSATPPSLHFTPEMETKGYRYIHAKYPWLWDIGVVAKTIVGMLES